MQQWEQFEHLIRATSLRELGERTTRFLHALGMNNFGYARLARGGQSSYERSQISLYDYGAPVSAHYEALRDPATAADDPRVRHSRAHLPALAWNVRGEFGYSPPPQARRIFAQGRRLIMNAGDFGTRAGITVPCWSAGTEWGFATFSTNDTYELRDIRNLTPVLVYLAHCIQCATDRISSVGIDIPKLGRREIDALSWSAIGKTSWEISRIMEIAESTVNFHLANVARKLGVKGRRAAVARAITLGLIRP